MAEAALRRLYPMAGSAHLVGITGPPGSGKSTLVSALDRRGAGGRSSRRGRGGRPVVADHRWRAARRPRADAVVRRRSRRVHPVDGVARPRRRARLDHDDRGRGARRRRLRPRADRDRRAPARARSRSRRRPTRPSCWRRPRWATRCRRSRPGSSRSPTSSSSTRATSPVRCGPRPSCGRCSSRPSVAIADPSRPAPKRPEVLVTTASTGEGVPELLAALDRHRTSGARGPDRGGAPGAGAGPGPRRSSPTGWRIGCAIRRWRRCADSLVDDVADHRLDPYAAADRLLEAIAREER